MATEHPIGIIGPRSRTAARHLVDTWIATGARSRLSIAAGGLATLLGVGLLLLGSSSGRAGLLAAAAPTIIAGASMLSLPGIVLAARRDRLRDAGLLRLEEEAGRPEASPRLAWDVARFRLEGYLDRNLAQVSAIFALTVVAMASGLALVGVGVWRAIDAPGGLAPGALAALAGVVVQAIGGTLLLVHKATMDQAGRYVAVLERINAVGMSLNVLEGLRGEDPADGDAARKEIARDVLDMYRPRDGTAGPTPRGGNARPARRRRG